MLSARNEKMRCYVGIKKMIIFNIFLLIFLSSSFGQNGDVLKVGEKKTYEYYIEGKRVSEDEFIKNNKTGTEKVLENGILRYEIELEEGKEHGKYIEYFENGHFARLIEYKIGRIDGPYIEWHENGQIKTLGYWDYKGSEESIRQVIWDEEGNLIQDSAGSNRNWKERKWYESGILAEECELKDREEYRSKYYYENGQNKHEWYLIEEIGKYIDIKYYENGQIKSHGKRERKSKQKEGTWIIWNKDDSIKSIQTWKEGRRVDPPIPNYFPRELFYDEAKKEIDTFRLEHYSEKLSALEEPVLYNLKTTKEIYRFTLLRGLDEPVSVRIEKEGDQVYLFAKMTDVEKELSGIIEPGILIMNTKKKINIEYWEEYLTRLDKINYWKMEAREKVKIEKGTIFVQTDGSHWILEGLKKGQYHFVERWGPDQSNIFRKCCEYLLELSDLKIEKIY